MNRSWFWMLVFGCTFAAAGPVMAQALVDTPLQGIFVRDRNISVADRGHPEYDPNTVRLGSLDLRPMLDVGLEDNDNIYATSADKKGDAIVVLTPEIDLNSGWPRDAFNAFFKLPVREYAHYTGESTTDWQFGTRGRLDIARGALDLGGDIGYLTEPRYSNTTARDTLHPIRYLQSDFFFGGVEDLGRVRLSTRYDFQRLEYHDAVSDLGVVLHEAYRNHDSHTLTGKAEYALAPAASFFLDASYNVQRYDLPTNALTVNGDSQGGFFDVGASFELTNLMRAQVQIGYLGQTFGYAGYTPISGLSAQGKVEWFPTQLTTVTLNGYRGVQDSGIIGSSAYLAEVVGLQADHELFRNMILTARASYENDTFNGLSRKDNNLTASIGARYQMNRLVGFTLLYTYLEQLSHGLPATVGPQYIVDRLSLTARFTL